MVSLLVVWSVVTVASALGLVLFLAFDEWQVRSQAAKRPVAEQQGESEGVPLAA